MLPVLRGLLASNSSSRYHQEACWIISNIAAGTQSQKQAVIDNDLLPLLILALNDGAPDTQSDAVYAVTNLLENETDSQVRCVVEAGAIPCLCDKLNASDPDLAMVLLEGVLSVLEVRLRVTRSCAYLKSSSFILAPSSQIGAQDASSECSQTNLYAAAVKECGGLEGLRQLEKSGNTVIAGMASSVLTKFFYIGPGKEEQKPLALLDAAREVSGCLRSCFCTCCC